ncbi:MAG: hypothetical protein JKY54_02565 [Flavobacteriales bacterium]|nr:hypothetical protein [Flavobacteriales bacterium]
MKLTYVILEAEEIGPYIPDLSELERGIRYPIDDGKDHFTISHGEQYTPFFESMGKPRFMAVVDDGKTIGLTTGVWKDAVIRGKKRTALYSADTKLRKDYRGKKIASKMLIRALWAYLRGSKYHGWDLIYFAAMVGKKGDISRTFKKFHLGNLASPKVQFKIFFVDPPKLAQIEINNGNDGLQKFKQKVDLSPNNKGVVSNRGKKDLTFDSNGQVWDLAHINLDLEQPILIQLKSAGEALVDKNEGALACFAIDSKMSLELSALKKNGITTETHCNLFTFSWPFKVNVKKGDLVNLSTAEI